MRWPLGPRRPVVTAIAGLSTLIVLVTVIVLGPRSCRGRGASSRGAVGAAIGAAIASAVETSAGERAPWRCAALDRPVPPAATLALATTTWKTDGRILRRETTAPGRRPTFVKLAVLADAESASPATLAALAKLRAKLVAQKIDVVIALGGMSASAAELVRVYGALAGDWPVIAIPGDREPADGHRAAVAALADRGVVDGAVIRWVVAGGTGVATLPGQPFASRLAHGVDGCGHADPDAAAILAAAPEGLTLRLLATQRAPRHRSGADSAALGAAAGDPGLASALAGSGVDLVVHASLDGRASPPGRLVRAAAAAGPAPARAAATTIATGVASATPRFDAAGRRIMPALLVLTIDGGRASWQPMQP